MKLYHAWTCYRASGRPKTYLGSYATEEEAYEDNEGFVQVVKDPNVEDCGVYVDSAGFRQFK